MATDAELIGVARGGSEAALEELFRRYWPLRVAMGVRETVASRLSLADLRTTMEEQRVG